jgi:protein-S-isoprenylcysteine O-methyltransferase Ste14
MTETPDSDDVPGVIMFPPLILLIAVAASVAGEFLLPLSFLPAPGLGNPLSWIGAILFIAGPALSAAGSREFDRQGTNVRPNLPALKLVTSGPYRFTRNPMYLGMIIGLGGLVLAASLDFGVLVWVLFVLVLHFGVVLREEQYLTRKFGAPYAEFLSKTRRWL